MSRLLGTHIGLAFVALLTAGALFSVAHLATVVLPKEPNQTILTAAFTKPVSLAVAVGQSGNGGIVSIGQEGGSETVAIALPSTWTRTEIRGAPLAAAQSTPLSAAWTSWQIPPGSTLRFSAPILPLHAALALPSGLPAYVIVTTVNLADGSSTSTERLVQEATAPLW
jgi:hypothetical protein